MKLKFNLFRWTIILFAIGGLSNVSFAQEISFQSTNLSGDTLNNPTSLDFGPDGRLYVAQQDGTVWAYTVQRDNAEQGNGSYTVVNSEAITIVQTDSLNHTDDGAPTTLKERQVTGIKTAGSADNPVLYVSSSDSLIGGGGNINDKNLDTNSGMLSKLTWNGEAWEKIDLVRGLPRCEENHSTNGLDMFERDGQTYILLQQGGHSNKGAPSNNFVGTTEYYLSAALLIINVTQLESMPVFTDPRSNTAYVYDLPTLNDPIREDIDASDPRFPYPEDHPMYNAIIDVGDPFGGNDSLNQAIPEPNGPVQVFSPGYRNAYDVVVTNNGNIYTYDNGPNTNWGGLPVIYTADGISKGTQNTTTYEPENGDYIKNDFNEAGSSGHGDILHYVGTTADEDGTYYGGHPNPIWAFPTLADLITYKNIDGSWQETSRYSFPDRLTGVSGYFNSALTIDNFPNDPRAGEYLADGVDSDKVNILDIINSSTNGITEYTASNFSGAMQGNILAASFNGNITRYAFTEDGSELEEKETLFSGFGSVPLDVIAIPDDQLFAGTVWAATYGANNITIFEPTDLTCPAINGDDYDPNEDYDNDGYTNQDEQDNNTNYCSGGNTPKDNDLDFISDLNDSDDDNDGIPDVNDVFAIDPENGLATQLPVNHPFWNNDPGTGFFGLGFTGLMLNPVEPIDYLSLFDEDNMSFGGAAGKASIDLIPNGDPIATKNTAQYGFQYGVNVNASSPRFTVHGRVESPFFGVNGSSTNPKGYQAVGIFIGNGDQDNYVKVVLGTGTNRNDDLNGIEILSEDQGSVAFSNRYDIENIFSGNAVDIFISIEPGSNTAQVYLSLDSGQTVIAIGSPFDLPEAVLSTENNSGMAVGLIATSYNSNTEFSAVWDFLNVTEDQPGVISVSSDANDGDLDNFDFGDLTVNGESALLNIDIQNLSGPGDEPLEILSIEFSGEDSDLFTSSLINLPVTLGPAGELILPIAFTPGSVIGEKTAVLNIYYSGSSSPISITLSAEVEEIFEPLIRINAGGAAVIAIDNGPNWLADLNTLGSNAFSVNTGIISNFGLIYENKHSSIPSYIDEASYEALFLNERWDPAANPVMTYSIPLSNGEYDVNLYMGNGFEGTSEVGQRIFDVAIEGLITISELDLSARFGDQSGGLITIPVTVEDGELTIEFIHDVENPLVNAIEIMGAPQPIEPLSLETIVDKQNIIGDSIDFAVLAAGGSPTLNYLYSMSGAPDGIQIEPTNGQVFGIIGSTSIDGGIAHDGVHTVVITLSQEGVEEVSTEFQWRVSQNELTWIDLDEDENYVARHECSFVQAGNEFIMFGGRESAQELDVYDYENNTWRKGAEAPAEFNHFQAVSYEGLVWVIAAFKNNSFPNETPAEYIYMYDPAKEEWIQGREVPESRRRGGAGIVVHDDKFYILGGNTIGHNGGYVPWFDVYDPQTGIWTELEDAPHSRDHFHAGIADEKLYAIGGRLSGGDGGIFAPLVAEVDVFDFATNTWSTLNDTNNLPTPRAAPAVATLNGEIYIMGGEGENSGPAFDIVEVFDPIENSWRTENAMNHARHGTQAIVSGEGIYIAGGSPTRGGGNQTNMEVLGEDNAQDNLLVLSRVHQAFLGALSKILSTPTGVSISEKSEYKESVEFERLKSETLEPEEKESLHKDDASLKSEKRESLHKDDASLESNTLEELVFVNPSLAV